MTKATIYPQWTIWLFIITIFALGLALFVIDKYLETQNNSQVKDKDFVEVMLANIKSVEQSDTQSAISKTEEVTAITNTPTSKYIEVTASCGPHYDIEECLNVRNMPNTEALVVAKLRNGIVLKVSDVVEVEGKTWYKVEFAEWLRYPERIKENWYVSADYVTEFIDVGSVGIENVEDIATTTKHILIERSKQKLTAYDGDTMFMETAISTGLDLSPTPRGVFTIFRKTPTRYMQGPLPGIPGSNYYDLPGVPWNLYFTQQGAVIHGAYWHNSFGIKYSHGCVNLLTSTAKELYLWADLGTVVEVRD